MSRTEAALGTIEAAIRSGSGQARIGTAIRHQLRCSTPHPPVQSFARSAPEGTRLHLGALLLAYYAPDGPLVYAGRAGTGMPVRELARLAARLKPLTTDLMPLDVPPPRGSRFGSSLVLSRVHWVRPELVAEVLT